MFVDNREWDHAPEKCLSLRRAWLSDHGDTPKSFLLRRTGAGAPVLDLGYGPAMLASCLLAHDSPEDDQLRDAALLDGPAPKGSFGSDSIGAL